MRTEKRQSLVQRLNCGTAELQDKEYTMCGIRTAELKVTAYSLFGSGMWNFKSQNILCAEADLQVTDYSACGISLVPYAMARMTRERRDHRPLGQSHLGSVVIYCSILATASTGIRVCFLRYYKA